MGNAVWVKALNVSRKKAAEKDATFHLRKWTGILL